MIQLEHISAGYGGPLVVQDVSLDLNPGEVLVLLGPNGCGKSTLLRVIAGLQPPAGGQVLVDGQPAGRLTRRQLAQKVTYLPQSRTVPNITAYRMVLHGRFPYLSYPRRYRPEDHAAARKALEQADAWELAQLPVQTLSGGQLRFALASTDRERRRAAYEAQQQTALENAEALEQLLRDLVHARNQLARENGFDNFADYGDLCMQRLGYGRAELDGFCRQVQTHIAPLYLRLQEEQRQRLGVEALLPYDRALVFPEGNAVPVAAEELPEAARRMYHALSPEAGEFFDEMVRHDLLDVTGSPNKISGMGFCDMLGAPYRMPFIFANCDGTAGDVTVYTHELGHGLQGYLSIRSQPVADYAGLSPDLAEVHSKTMELLAQPYALDFFGNHAPQFLTEHRYDFIKELCAFCSIHTFETWLYEHPDASLAQWAEEFDRIEKSFGRARNNEPWRKQVLSGCDLFTNVALYMFPRYVISYALSIVCAQQLKAAYDADPADGWTRYHALCASGGSRLYAETLSDAGLPLPYAPGVVESLAQDLARQFWG